MAQSEILYEGDLSEHPVPRLLNYLYEHEQTGRLVLQEEGINKTIYTIQGIPASVESSLRDETLGRYLVKQGAITEEDYEQSVEMMRSENIQQGAALVKLGKLKPKELYQVMKSQTLHKIATAFSFQDGQYRFYSETEFISRITRFEFSIHQVLKEGIYSFFPEEILDRELKRLGAEALTPLASYQKRLLLFSLTDQEREFALMIDGNQSLTELINLEPAYPFARRLIYMLALCGLIGVGGKIASYIRELVPTPLEPEPKPESEAQLEPSFELEPETKDIIRTGGIVISSQAPEAVEMQESGEGEEISAPAQESVPEMKLEQEASLGEEKVSPDWIGEFYIQMKGMSYADLLGVSEDANDKQVEDAYRRRLEEFDRVRFPAQMDPEMEQKLEEINTEIIKAYESLRIKERREKYIEQLKEKESGKKSSLDLEAEKYLQDGIKCVRSRDWSGAQKMFEMAIELKPEEPEYYGYLGWSIYCNTELKPEERRELAKEKIKQAIKMNPNMYSAHVFLGKILKDEGKKIQSVYEFREALRCNPNCKEAKKELEAQGIKI